jgi:F420-0:gamma-glutamyl ligase-like protein
MTSGEYFGCFFITPFSQTMEPLQNPGRFILPLPATSQDVAEAVRGEIKRLLDM